MKALALIAPTLRARLRRFGREDRAVAAVEFALILPFLLMLYIGSIEASSLITVDRRVNVVSSTVGDLVSRWDSREGELDADDLVDYFKASQNIIFPYSTADLIQTVSFVEIAANGTTKVLWSCSYSGTPKVMGEGREVDSTYDSIPANVNLISRGKWVVASEAYYPYTPVLGVIFDQVYDLRRESFYLPRFENDIVGPDC